MDTYLDIPYTQQSAQDLLRSFDLYLPPSFPGNTPAPPLICYVHGGAWRTDDKSAYPILAKRLAAYTKCPVALPNYRLTPMEETKDNMFRHPAHSEDLLQFLEFVLTWQGPTGLGRPYDPEKLYLMGHSCSAHMLSAIFLDSSSVTPTLTPSEPLLGAVQALIMSQGLYDLDQLLLDFPNYMDWFIGRAFGRFDSYAPYAVTSYGLRQPYPWLLIHSKGDVLVNALQSELMLQSLRLKYGEVADSRVFYDTSLTQDHGDIAKTEEFVEIVGRFILDVRGASS